MKGSKPQKPNFLHAMNYTPENRVEAKLTQQTHKHSKHALSPESMAKVRAENRRQTLLKYLLIVLLGIALLAMASIIDAADDDYCPETDQIGTARPQGAGCDIGAIEYAAPLKETT